MLRFCLSLLLFMYAAAMPLHMAAHGESFEHESSVSDCSTCTSLLDEVAGSNSPPSSQQVASLATPAIQLRQLAEPQAFSAYASRAPPRS